MQIAEAKLRKGTIYLITNLVNGKRYVGKIILTLAKRWSLHKSDARRGTGFPISRAIRKYGAKNFSIEVLALAVPRRLDGLEKKFIKYLNTLVDNKCGYNSDEGGRGNRGFFSKETRLKIAAVQKARWKNKLALRAKHGAAVKALRADDPGILLRQSESMKAVHAADPEIARKHADDMRKSHAAHPQLAIEHSDRMRRLWQDVDSRAAVIAGQRKSYATHPERATKHSDYMADRWRDKDFQDKMCATHASRYGDPAERNETGAACQASGIVRNSTGYRGVSKHGSGWGAKIKYRRKTYHLGTHRTPEADAHAYNQKAVELFGPDAFQNRVLAARNEM